VDVIRVVAGVAVLDENIMRFDVSVGHRLWTAMEVRQSGQALVEDGQALLVRKGVACMNFFEVSERHVLQIEQRHRGPPPEAETNNVLLVRDKHTDNRKGRKRRKRKNNNIKRKERKRI
jgi:hypothetical protein